MTYTCTHCGCTSVYTQQKGPHLGVYCSQCGAWVSWAKKGTKIDNKTKAPVANNIPPANPVQGSAVTSVNNVPVVSPTTPPWETEKPVSKEVTLRVYGFVETVTAQGVVKTIPQNTKVVITNGRISIYDIATDELLDSYTV